MNEDTLWQTKLAARLHDPAEKALVLLRDPAGHENGTSLALARLSGLTELPGDVDLDDDEALARTVFKRALPRDIYRHVQRADWWAAAADRPQWPLQEITVTTKSGERKTLAVASWAQVRWTQQPVLIHPLTGHVLDLGALGETEIGEIKRRSFEHFSELLVKLGVQDGEAQDWRKTLLTYWRFGPDLAVTGADTDDHHKLGRLWEVLPADTRVPDHSIWDHLDLTSAFAGAFAGDPKGEAALLALSIGPVQGFIAAARSTSDLWAGSHLLSRLAWQAMRPVCEALGPDAILFPRLRGIPQVDLWLRDGMGLPAELFRECDWSKGGTDANPLFSAALPNRFVAVVPASHARQIAETVTREVRGWLLGVGKNVVRRLLHAAGFDEEATATPYEQMEQQLAGFPEVHWAAVPFSLIRCRDAARQRGLDTTLLSEAMAPFFHHAPPGTRGGGERDFGFLASAAWRVLQKDLDWSDGTTFFSPNPGVLYPAVYDLAERVLAAAKATRAFDQISQHGWRDSLTGEAEWLTADRDLLKVSAGKRRSRKDKRGFREGEHVETLWTRIADKESSWARKGEHLGALSAIKRLWPTIFAEEVQSTTGKAVGRFVVSTHTMALAHQLDRWLERGGLTAEGFAEVSRDAERVALPRRIVRRHAKNAALEDAKRIPGLLEAADETERDATYEQAQRVVRQTLGRALGKDEAKLETYYALLMMDGDRMGAILSGEEKTDTAISYRASFHLQVQRGFDQHAARQALIQQYCNQRRPVSPGRHLAISGALNDFSQTVARHVVEEEHLGRVIYAGGDDVLAMLPVADLLPCMQRLRHAYSGTLPEDENTDWGELRKARGKLHCKGGFAFLDGRLMRMMGRHATASCGAVIAHHQAPLGAVLRELRAAEKRAKAYQRPGAGGVLIDRDAFHITVIKRSGGALGLSAEWGKPNTLLSRLIAFLRDDGTSRRAVYNALEWLTDLPQPHGNGEMLASLLAYQLARQTRDEALRRCVPGLAADLAALAAQQVQDGLAWLQNFLTVAEFLARETRASGAESKPLHQEVAA